MVHIKCLAQYLEHWWAPINAFFYPLHRAQGEGSRGMSSQYVPDIDMVNEWTQVTLSKLFIPHLENGIVDNIFIITHSINLKKLMPRKGLEHCLPGPW